MRNILAEVGYNPLVSYDQFNKFFDRFSKDPETKELFEKMSN
ncbi:MAG TPA: hypothetical protein VNS58_30180 [Puia sp.]|nr:hypothetical protein [Puia sp.]